MKPHNGVWCLTFFYLAFWALRPSNGPSNTVIAVQGFSFHGPPRITREYQSRSHRPLYSLQKPTVTNPLTGKQIVIGKGTYSSLLSQGKFVQHNGTLQELDLSLLSRFQQQDDNGEERMEKVLQASPYYQQYAATDFVTTTDAWYPIRPTAVVDSTPASLSSQDETKLQQEVLFVHKPSGLHCVPPRDVSQPCLSQMIQETYGQQAKPCHRLDRDTSGIVVFGLTPSAHSTISQQFEAKTTSKMYWALVAGHPTHDTGQVDLPIGKRTTPEGYNQWTTPTILEEEGQDPAEMFQSRPAMTHWKVLKRFASKEGATYSLVELTPKTGRGHQLRLHMKAIGHPILGDTIHAPDAVAYCSPRLCLHAHQLQVDWCNVRLEATSPSPF